MGARREDAMKPLAPIGSMAATRLDSARRVRSAGGAARVHARRRMACRCDLSMGGRRLVVAARSDRQRPVSRRREATDRLHLWRNGARVRGVVLDGSARAYRWGFVYLVVAVAGSTLLVALLKDVTHVNCPWSVDRYGGEVPYLSTWREVLHHGRSGRCFPSGHAGSGYALVAWYFFCRRFAPRWRWVALGVAIGLGVAFGVAQQLRGAHYLSHDVWALAICWFVAVAATPLLKRGSCGELVDEPDRPSMARTARTRRHADSARRISVGLGGRLARLPRTQFDRLWRGVDRAAVRGNRRTRRTRFRHAAGRTATRRRATARGRRSTHPVAGAL